MHLGNKYDMSTECQPARARTLKTFVHCNRISDSPAGGLFGIMLAFSGFGAATWLLQYGLMGTPVLLVALALEKNWAWLTRCHECK